MCLIWRKVRCKMGDLPRIHPIQQTRNSLKATPSAQQYEWAWNKLYDLRSGYKGKPEINVYYPSFARVAKQRGMPDFDKWYNHFFLGRCFFGKFMSIAENGDTIPCSFNDIHRFGNVKEKSLKTIWDELQTSEFYSRVRDKNNLKGKCAVCEYSEICGGCRTAAEFFTGDIFGSDPRCAYIPKSYANNPTPWLPIVRFCGRLNSKSRVIYVLMPDES